MGLKCLSVLVKSAQLQALNTDGRFKRLGRLAKRSLDSQDAEVRKSAVQMCVEMHARIGDMTVLFEEVLEGLPGGHQNLLVYYIKRRERED